MGRICERDRQDYGNCSIRIMLNFVSIMASPLLLGMLANYGYHYNYRYEHFILYNYIRDLSHQFIITALVT